MRLIIIYFSSDRAGIELYPYLEQAHRDIKQAGRTYLVPKVRNVGHRNNYLQAFVIVPFGKKDKTLLSNTVRTS